jgi:hypothetical protein
MMFADTAAHTKKVCAHAVAWAPENRFCMIVLFNFRVLAKILWFS